MSSVYANDIGVPGGGAEDFEIVRHPVPARFDGLVLRISGYRETARRLIRQTESASLVAPLILSFGEAFEIGLGREPDGDERYTSFAAGLYGGPVHIRSHGAAHCLQIDFTPAGAFRFFGMPMRDLADRMVPVDDLSDRALVEFRERLGTTPDWPARFALAECFVEDRLRQSPAVTPQVARAYDWIVGSRGTVSIAALARRIEWSRKHLAIRFRDEIGLTPKSVARIARFLQARQLAGRANDTNGTGGADWADVAAACGYADQAHLVREFNAFAGTTPTGWQAGVG